MSASPFAGPAGDPDDRRQDLHVVYLPRRGHDPI